MSSATKVILFAILAVFALGVMVAWPTISVIWGIGTFKNKTIDVTNDPTYWGGYKPGEFYDLKVDIFDVGGGLFAPGARTVSAGTNIPSTIDEYRADPARWPEIRMIVPRGTRFCVTRFELYQSFEYSNLSIYATFKLASDAARSIRIAPNLSVLDDSANTNGHGLAVKANRKILDGPIDPDMPK